MCSLFEISARPFLLEDYFDLFSRLNFSRLTAQLSPGRNYDYSENKSVAKTKAIVIYSEKPGGTVEDALILSSGGRGGGGGGRNILRP